MAWVQDIDIDYSGKSDTAASAMSSSVDGLLCTNNTDWFISGGRLRNNNASGNLIPRYLADTVNHRHKVVITADAPVLDTAGSFGAVTTILGIDHYRSSIADYLWGGFLGATNLTPSSGVGYGNNGTYNLAGSAAVSVPTGSFTITFTNDFNSGTANNLTAVSSGTSGSATDISNQPNPGSGAGVLIGGDGTTRIQQGISRVQIYHWDGADDSGGPLGLAGTTGTAVVTGNHLAIAAPPYLNGGATITYTWKYTTTVDGSSFTTITTGSVTNPAVVPDLAWDVPSGQRNQMLYVVCEISDGTTDFPAIGPCNVGGSVFSSVGGGGVYIPAYVPMPTIPTNSVLSALWTPPSSGKTILALIGDSITNHVTTMQSTLDTIFGTGKILVINAGHIGSAMFDWLQGAATTGQGASILSGQSANNNFNGLLNTINANQSAGDKLVLSVMLGTNPSDTTSTATADIADLQTLLSQLNSTYANAVGIGMPAPIVLHDMIYRFNWVNGGNVSYLDLEAENHSLLANRPPANLWAGTNLTRGFFADNFPGLYGSGPDPIHPSIPDGSDALMRFWLIQVLPAVAYVNQTPGGGGGSTPVAPFYRSRPRRGRN